MEWALGMVDCECLLNERCECFLTHAVAVVCDRRMAAIRRSWRNRYNGQCSLKYKTNRQWYQ